MTSASGTGEAILSLSAGAVDARVRKYLSSSHLAAADFHARECRRLETALLGQTITDVAHTSYALSAVTASVSFVESLANEVLLDADQASGLYVEHFTSQQLSDLSTFWNSSDRKKGGKQGWANIRTKLHGAVTAVGVADDVFGRAPYQDLETLIRIRDAMTHFKPETVGSGVPVPLETECAAKFSGNTLVAPTSSWFPERCFGAGCAEWAARTARAVADDWTALLGVTPRYV